MAGTWIGASFVLGRAVDTSEPYPHICDREVRGRATGQRFVIWRRDCAACAEQNHRGIR